MNKVLTAIISICVFEHVFGQLEPCTDRKDGWYEFDGNCYNFVDGKNNPRTWDAAQRWCESMDSNLASVDTKQENEYISNAREQLLATYPTSWIGLRAVGLGSAFKWSDDSALNFNNWRDFKTPVPEIQTSCVVMVDTGKWLPTDCSVLLRSFICKKNNITFVPTTPPEEVDGNCLENWYKFEKKCYRFYTDTVADGGGKEFNEADKTCKKFGANLASIHSDDEQDFLTLSVGAFNNTLWIGAKRPSSWGGQHEWMDKTSFDYTNWAPGEPSSNYGEPCLEMYHLNNVAGKWNDVPCEKRLGFICKMHSDEKLPKQKVPYVNCPYGYFKYRQACFKLDTTARTFANAENACQSNGGHLATVGDNFDQAFLNLLAKANISGAWIGLSDTDKTRNGLFSWIDGWPVYFTKWGMDQPQPETQFNRCVALKKDRTWSVMDCNSTLPFFCRKRDFGDKKPYIPVVIGNCPESNRTTWIDVGNNYCYHAEYKNTGDWTKASMTCGLLGSGAKLASFHSQHDLDLMRSVITDSETNIYIGLIQDTDGGYVWSDGSAADFVPWDNGEPTPSKNEACVEILPHKMKYNNIACSATRGYVCEVDKIPGPTVAPTVPEPSDCGPRNENWKYFNGTCYQIMLSYSAAYTWHEANDYCNKKGAHLLSIHSSEENAFIFKHVSSWTYYSAYWIGLSATNNEGFEWTDDTVVNFDALQGTSEELLLKDEKCATISRLNKDSMSWNLELCSAKQSLICKREHGIKPSTITPKPTTATPGFCPDGWSRTGNKCIKLFGTDEEDRANFTAASALCKAQGNKASLMAIQNEKEQALATSLLLGVKVNVWIGLTKKAYGYEFRWTDNSRFLYHNWGIGMPSNNFYTDVCGMLQVSRNQPGKWKTSVCLDDIGYLCQIAPSTSVVTTTPMPPDCWTKEEGFVKYGNNCFKIYEEEQNWKEAEATCQKAGGHLASINSGLEQNFVNTRLEMLSGGNNQSTNGLWIGLSDDNGRRFKWADTWPVYFTNWGVSQPQPSNNTRCALLDTIKREWNSTDCTDKMGFICETSKDKPPVVPDEPNAECPPHAAKWEDFGMDHCYIISKGKFYSERKAWGDATMDCLQKNAELASVHSQHEIDLLGPHLTESSNEIWIGLLKKHNGEFGWYDNSPVDFELWDDKEPNQAGNYQCGAFVPSTGKWKAMQCNTMQGYICRVKKVPRNNLETSGASTGMGGGAVAAVVIFVILGSVAVAGVVYFYLKRRSMLPNVSFGKKGVGFDNHLYETQSDATA